MYASDSAIARLKRGDLVASMNVERQSTAALEKSFCKNCKTFFFHCVTYRRGDSAAWGSMIKFANLIIVNNRSFSFLRFTVSFSHKHGFPLKARLSYTGLLGGLEHLKIETRLIDEMFTSVMGEYVFLK